MMEMFCVLVWVAVCQDWRQQPGGGGKSAWSWVDIPLDSSIPAPGASSRAESFNFTGIKEAESLKFLELSLSNLSCLLPNKWTHHPHAPTLA